MKILPLTQERFLWNIMNYKVKISPNPLSPSADSDTSADSTTNNPLKFGCDLLTLSIPICAIAIHDVIQL